MVCGTILDEILGEACSSHFLEFLPQKQVVYRARPDIRARMAAPRESTEPS